MGEQTSLALRELLPQPGVDLPRFWSEDRAINILAILELDWVNLPSETGAQSIESGMIEELLYHLASYIYTFKKSPYAFEKSQYAFKQSSFAFKRNPGNLMEITLETHFRVLAAALRLYKAQRKPLPQELHLALYESINTHNERYDFYGLEQSDRSIYGLKRINRITQIEVGPANVEFLLTHCQYTLLSIDTTQLPSRLFARKAIVGAKESKNESLSGSILNSNIADLLKRRRERPGWHDVYLSLEDTCWSIFGQDIISQVFSGDSQQDLLNDVILTATLLSSYIKSSLGPGEERFTDFIIPRLWHFAYDENLSHDLCFGVLDIIYRFWLRIDRAARLVCYDEFTKVIRIVLASTFTQNSIIHAKAIELWNYLSFTQTKSLQEKQKDEDDHMIIEAWIKKHPRLSESFDNTIM